MTERLTSSVIVERSGEQHYKMWSHMQDSPKFMRHTKSVIPTGRLTSHWVMEGPMGRSIEWDAGIIETDLQCFKAYEGVPVHLM